MLRNFDFPYFIFYLLVVIFILTGPVHSGKTTFLKKVVYKLRDQKFKIDGFLSEVVLESQKIVGYDLLDLKEENSLPFIRREGEKGWQKIGAFFFIPQSLKKAKKIIIRGKDADILVVDEVGPQELAGKGLWPVLKQVIFHPLTRCLLVVRRGILGDILGMLNRCEVKVFDIKNKNISPRLIDEIKKSIRNGA